MFLWLHMQRPRLAKQLNPNQRLHLSKAVKHHSGDIVSGSKEKEEDESEASPYVLCSFLQCSLSLSVLTLRAVMRGMWVSTKSTLVKITSSGAAALGLTWSTAQVLTNGGWRFPRAHHHHHSAAACAVFTDQIFKERWSCLQRKRRWKVHLTCLM